MNLNKLPKDLLIKLISEINDISNMSIKELEKKQEEIKDILKVKKIKESLNDKNFYLINKNINFKKIKLLNLFIEWNNIKFYLGDENYSCQRKSCSYYPYNQYIGNLLEILPENIINDIFIFYYNNDVPIWLINA
jgi:hypothetical protein